MVSEELLEVLRTQDRDLGKEQFTLDKRSLCVVEHSPHGDQVLKLAAGLLHDTLLPLQDNCHAREIIDLGVADDQAVDVEATGSQDTRDAGEHTGLVLHQAVEDVALVRLLGGQRGFVENAADSGRRRPGRRTVFGGERRNAAVQSLVSQSLRR
jgi:hypothetical protein